VDLFLTGGDSLKLAELLVAIDKRFAVRTSMREVLSEGATVAAIARLIERAPVDERRAGALRSLGRTAANADGSGIDSPGSGGETSARVVRRPAESAGDDS